MTDPETINRRKRLERIAEEMSEELNPRSSFKYEYRSESRNGKLRTVRLKYRTQAEREALLKASELIDKADRFGRVHRRNRRSFNHFGM